MNLGLNLDFANRALLGGASAAAFAAGEALMSGYHWEFVYDASGVLVTAPTARSSNEPVVAQVRN